MAHVDKQKKQQLNSRTTLEEITERVESALAAYESLDENSEFAKGLRRSTERQATYGELATAGRARVEVYVVALNEIARERSACLQELRNKLEAEKESAEKDEKEERRREGREQIDTADDTIMENSALIERIDFLETLQVR